MIDKYLTCLATPKVGYPITTTVSVPESHFETLCETHTVEILRLSRFPFGRGPMLDAHEEPGRVGWAVTQHGAGE